MKRFFLVAMVLFFIFIAPAVLAQDTLRVHFALGDTSITPEQKNFLSDSTAGKKILYIGGGADEIGWSNSTTKKSEAFNYALGMGRALALWKAIGTPTIDFPFGPIETATREAIVVYMDPPLPTPAPTPSRLFVSPDKVFMKAGDVLSRAGLLRSRIVAAQVLMSDGTTESVIFSPDLDCPELVTPKTIGLGERTVTVRYGKLTAPVVIVGQYQNHWTVFGGVGGSQFFDSQAYTRDVHVGLRHDWQKWQINGRFGATPIYTNSALHKKSQDLFVEFDFGYKLFRNQKGNAVLGMSLSCLYAQNVDPSDLHAYMTAYGPGAKIFVAAGPVRAEGGCFFTTRSMFEGESWKGEAVFRVSLSVDLF